MSQVSNPIPCFFCEKNELSPFSHKLGKNDSDKPEKFFLADIYLTWAKYEQIQSETFDQIWETCQLNDLWKLSELFSEFYAAICQFSWVLFRIFAVIHFWISVMEMATSFFLLLCHYHIQNVLVISTIYYNFFHWFNFFFYFFICLDQQWRKMMETVANDLYHFQNPPKLLIILYFWKFSLASFMHQSFNRGEILWKLISEKWKFGIKFSQQKTT